MSIRQKIINHLMLLIIPIILLGCANNNLNEIREARLQELKSLVSIGLDVDQAVEVLEKSDFKIAQGKLKPAGENGDYYSVIVLLIKDYNGPGLRSTLYELTDWPIFYDDFSPFAVIEAHLNGKIYLIE